MSPTLLLTLSSSAEATSPESVALYVTALAAQGAEVVTVAPGGVVPDLDEVDGVLLSGGVDIDPAEYGQERHPELGEVQAERDALELPLTREALARGLPILGICRGAQVLGVALGGQLHQHLPACVPGALVHSGPKEHPARHRVRLAPGGRLREILGTDTVETNSYHHQANSLLGPGVQAVAWAEDGVVEAVETDTGFALGIQWHPERMVAADPQQALLFAAFVAACVARPAR